MKLLDRPGLAAAGSGFLLMLIAACILSFHLGVRPFLSSGESRAAEIAAEMLARDDFLIPHLNEQILLTKPPLFHWLIITSYRMFGISEWSARLPSLLAGMLVLLLVFLFGKQFWDERTGFFSGLILLASPMFFWSVRCARIDALLLFFVTASLYCFWRGYQKLPGGKLWLLGWFFFMGLGVLSKGPIGAVGLVIVLLYLIYIERGKTLGRLGWIQGIIVFLLVVLPWYIMVYSRVPAGKSYLFFLQQNKAWLTGGGEWHKCYIYIFHLFFSFFPWSLFLPLAFISCWRQYKLNKDKDPRTAFLWTWLFVVFIIFSFAGKKVGRYILPLYPAAALLVGREIAQKDPRRLLMAGIGVLAGLWVFILAGVNFFDSIVNLWPGRVDPLLVRIISGYLRVSKTSINIVGCLLLVLGVIGMKKERFGLLVIMILSSFIMFTLYLIPIESRYYSPKPFCELLKVKTIPEHPVYGYKSWDYSIRFYYGQHVDVIHSEEELRRLLNSDRKVYIFMWEKRYQALDADQFSDRITEIIKGYRVMEHDVVLISI